MSVTNFTPHEIVRELDQYIIGQADAKRAVAIALRNRWRRQLVSPEIKDEISPKNIILIGPTGVGKTEIARRLAKLARSPFVKVEASKFTEVGYVGKDVESMIRDLTEVSIGIVKEEAREQVRKKAAEAAQERLLDALLPPSGEVTTGAGFTSPSPQPDQGSREKFLRMLQEGSLDEKMIEIDVAARSNLPIFRMAGPQGVEDMEIPDMVPGPLAELFNRRKTRKVSVADARVIFEAEEAEKLIDDDQVRQDAIERVEQHGIVFLDEIDKVAGRTSREAGGLDVSREGVQRDLLPIVEGSNVNTKHGMVRTDHILFIASGAFHSSKVSDLIPELQGRFPIRVELQPLGESDFVRILTEPNNSLTRQYQAMMETEQVSLEFEGSGVAKIAEVAAMVNERSENIGARRLHTVLEHLLEEISFEAPQMNGARVPITEQYVEKKLKGVVDDEDLSRYIL